MGRSGEATRARILERAYRLFYREGFTRVGMDAIAAAAGVTKRTLYLHFDSKDALAAAVLDHQHERVLASVRRWAPEPPRTPEELIAAIFGGIARWARTPRWLGSGYTRLSMELADLPGHPARVVARRHKGAVEAWIAEELARLGTPDPEAAAREAVLLMEGCISLVLIHGEPGYAEAAGRAALRLIARPSTPAPGDRGLSLPSLSR
jgi:AcrR family transcriptional regulator